tara:strand:+ start:53980 stop:54426 length:447 start_codon:yes stop_codon:yes gene_type:complete
MNLSSLKPADGAVNREGKRVGRGQGSGKGGTAKRGHKGAKSRSGYSRKIGFEGGQMPLQRRVPKFGFKNINRKEYQAVNLSKIQELADAGVTEINLDTLLAHNVVKKQDLVKILGNGELRAKVKVVAHKFSSSAAAAIEKVGGEAKTI